MQNPSSTIQTTTAVPTTEIFTEIISQAVSISSSNSTGLASTIADPIGTGNNGKTVLVAALVVLFIALVFMVIITIFLLIALHRKKQASSKPVSNCNTEELSNSKNDPCELYYFIIGRF